MKPLVTRRLLLRPFCPADFAALREIDGDPEVLRYRSRAIISPDASRAFLERALAAEEEQPQTYYPWAIARRADDWLVGQCGLTCLPPGFQTAFMWYSLNRQYWGRGYMTEAAAAVLAHGFQELNLSLIEAGCHPENLASGRVLEKIGLRPNDGQPPPPSLVEWPLTNRRRFALSRAEWLAQEPAT